MVAKFEVRTYKNIQDAVAEELGVGSTDTVLLNRIKRDINFVYLNEIVEYNAWKWARGEVDVQHEPFISAGTLTVTEGSPDITFSSAPTLSQVGAKINTSSQEEIYEIRSHVAGATGAQLTVKYGGVTSTTATYKLFRKAIPLPADAKETLQINQDFSQVPLEGVGLQEFREIEAFDRFFEERPRIYHLTDFRDPDQFSAVSGLPSVTTRGSAGLIKTIIFDASLRSDTSDPDTARLRVGDRIQVNLAGEASFDVDSVVSSLAQTTLVDDTLTYTALVPAAIAATADATMTIEKLNVEGQSEKYRELLVWPSMNDERTTLHVDYIKNLPILVDDDDEPAMPIEDRASIVYGALSRGWVKARNPETAAGNFSLFQNKLARMKGKLTDSKEQPEIVVNKRYLARKRATTTRKLGNRMF